MIVHSHANILDFKEKAFSLYFFMHGQSLLPSKIAYGGSPPGPSVFPGIDYLAYTFLPIALLC